MSKTIEVSFTDPSDRERMVRTLRFIADNIETMPDYMELPWEYRIPWESALARLHYGDTTTLTITREVTR